MAHGRRSQYCPKQKTVLHPMYYIIPAPERQSQSSFPGAVQIITAEIPCCQCQIHGISWGLARAPLMENLENLASFKNFLLSLLCKANEPPRRAARQHTWEAFSILFTTYRPPTLAVIAPLRDTPDRVSRHGTYYGFAPCVFFIPKKWYRRLSESIRIKCEAQNNFQKPHCIIAKYIFGGYSCAWVGFRNASQAHGSLGKPTCNCLYRRFCYKFCPSLFIFRHRNSVPRDILRTIS